MGLKGSIHVGLIQNQVLSTILIVGLLEIVRLGELVELFAIDAYDNPHIGQYAVVLLEGFDVLESAAGHAAFGGILDKGAIQ